MSFEIAHFSSRAILLGERRRETMETSTTNTAPRSQHARLMLRRHVQARCQGPCRAAAKPPVAKPARQVRCQVRCHARH
eukprot:2159674-Prymnesium_polylepis.1